MANARTSPEPTDRAESAAFRRVTLVALVAILLLAYAVVPRVFASRSVGTEAPDFTIPVAANPIAGHEGVHLAELKGSPVILSFWATWCGPCQAEAPLIDRVAQRYKDRGLVVVGVNTSDREGNAGAWARTRRVSYTIAYDTENAVAAAYGVETLPTLVVVSRTGKIVAVRHGITPDSELDRLVKQIL
jgi:thiol-disulfide isomerase/thioredoxin